MSRAARWVAALVALVFAPCEASAGWTLLQSPHFVFVGNVPEGQIRRTASRLEQFRALMLQALPGGLTSLPGRTVVLVFDDDRSFTPFKPQFNGRAIDVAGYFQGGEDVDYIAVNLEQGDAAFATVFHEFSHLLVGSALGPLPLWVHEGLAEMYETVREGDDGAALVGAVPLNHLLLLRNTRLIPLRDLMAVDASSPIYNEGNQRNVWYAQSWALMHYFLLGNDVRKEQFNQYIGLLRAGESQATAFTRTFGTGVELLEELTQYVRRFQFPAIRIDVTGVTAGGALRVVPLDDLDADVYLGDLQWRTGRTADARLRLTRVAQRRPENARAAAALGRLELQAGRLDEALRHLEDAAQHEPEDAFVQEALGRALYEQARRQRHVPRAAMASLMRARDVLRRATTLAPDVAGTAALLGYVELAIGTDLAGAAALLEQAVRLAQGRELYQLTLARVFVHQGDGERATALLQLLARRAGSDRVRHEARALIGELNLDDASIASSRASSIEPGASALLPSQPSIFRGPAGEPVSLVPDDDLSR